MGYTHYWKFRQNPKNIKDGNKKFAKAVELLKKCIAKVELELEDNDCKIPFVLKGGNGKGEPIFTNGLVCFNGDASLGYDHETFYLALNNDNYEFDFCKTARKPYDVAVCLTLLCFKKTFGEDFSYSSDSKDADGWKMANNIFDNIKSLKDTFSKNCIVIIDEQTSQPCCVIKSKKTLSDETLTKYAKQWIGEHNSNCTWSNYRYIIMDTNDAPKIKCIMI